MKIKYCALLLSIVVLGSVEGMENPDKKYVENSIVLLKSDGALLKNFLTLDKYGYCSKHIDEAAIYLEKSCGSILWAPCSSDTQITALLVMNRPKDREKLLKHLTFDRMDKVKKIVENNPYVLYRYAGDKKFDQINKLFIDKFITNEASSYRYNAYTKELLGEGFNLNVCNEQGVPLLSQIIKLNDDTDKYLDLLKAGVSVNCEDEDGDNPLSYAVSLSNQAMVSKLLLYGAVVNKYFCKNLRYDHPLQRFMIRTYSEQKCCVCDTHDEDDNCLFNIPCVNRHIGEVVSFICEDCYIDNKVKKCPVCFRTMGELGT